MNQTNAFCEILVRVLSALLKNYSLAWFLITSSQIFITSRICMLPVNHNPFRLSRQFSKTEQPSSSSLSTTTSSVTSMTSLEHESNDTSVSASDYGNDMASDYGNDGWDVAGDMDVSSPSIASAFLAKCGFLHIFLFHSRHHKIQAVLWRTCRRLVYH